MRSHEKYNYYLIIILAFLLYGNTISHDYALDDAIVITQNNYTKKGFHGIADIFTHDTFTGFFGVKKNLVSGGRYRPLSLVTFAIEYRIFGKNPSISHFINILLYAFTVLLIYKILLVLFIDFKSKFRYLSFPLIASLLYLAHPIHTEVVANIKGRDEVMTFLGALLALHYSLKYIEKAEVKYLLYSGVFFFLGLLSKENAITFLAIIPITLYFFRKPTVKQYMFIFIPLLISTVVFLFIRFKVIGSPNVTVARELMNNPFLHASTSEKIATIFSTFLIYFKLLIFPHLLTFDYYPKHIPIISWKHWMAVTSLILNTGLGIIAITRIRRRRIISYSILFYFITFSIVSNLFFPVGTFMNERFIFISSLGFCIVLAYLFAEGIPKLNIKFEKFSPFLVVIVLGLYSFKTIDRNKDWKNDFTLFTHDVKISGNSAKSNTSAGGKLLEEAIKKGNELKREKYLKQSIQYLEKAVEIHPRYVDALILLGNAWYEYNKNYEKTLYYYKSILQINPQYPQVFTNIDIIFNSLDSVDYEIKIWEELYKFNNKNYIVNYNLGNLYGRYKNDLEKSILYLEKAVKIDPKQSNSWKDLGVAYGIKKEFTNSARCLENAVKYNPKDAQTFFNLGITYLSLGDNENSDKNFNKAASLNPEIKKKLGR